MTSAVASSARSSSTGLENRTSGSCLGHPGTLDPATAERLDQVLVEDRAEPAQLAIDGLGLLDDAAEDRVLLPVLVEEVAAIDRRRRLKFAVDSAVALFEPGRVPGNVVVEQVEAVTLEIQALAGRVGRQQDPDRIDGGVGVEGFFDLLPFVERVVQPL